MPRLPLLAMLIVPLLFLAACDRLEEEDDHFGDVDRVEIRNRATNALLYYYQREQHAAGLQGPGIGHLHPGDELGLDVTFFDTHGHTAALGLNQEYQVQAEMVEPTDVLTISNGGDHVILTAEDEGTAEVVFHLWHGSHPDFTTPSMIVEVVEH